MQSSCIDFSITILYVIFISAFLGWALFHPTRERRRLSAREEPLLNIGDDGEVNSVNLEENENGATKAGFIMIFKFSFFLDFPFRLGRCILFLVSITP